MGLLLLMKSQCESRSESGAMSVCSFRGLLSLRGSEQRARLVGVIDNALTLFATLKTTVTPPGDATHIGICVGLRKLVGLNPEGLSPGWDIGRDHIAGRTASTRVQANARQ